MISFNLEQFIVLLDNHNIKITTDIQIIVEKNYFTIYYDIIKILGSLYAFCSLA